MLVLSVTTAAIRWKVILRADLCKETRSYDGSGLLLPWTWKRGLRWRRRQTFWNVFLAAFVSVLGSCVTLGEAQPLKRREKWGLCDHWRSVGVFLVWMFL